MGLPCAECWDQNGANAIGLFRRRFRVDQQRITAIVPSHLYFLIIGFDALGPTIPEVAVFGEFSFGQWNRRIRGICVQHTLNAVLQPSSQRDIVGVDAPTIVGEFALDIEDVAGPAI